VSHFAILLCCFVHDDKLVKELNDKNNKKKMLIRPNAQTHISTGKRVHVQMSKYIQNTNNSTVY